MLAVQAVGDELFVWVELVNHPIGVLLHASRENYDFVVLCHLPKELVAEGPDEEVRLVAGPLVNVVDQRLVEVEHESVLPLRAETTIA